MFKLCKNNKKNKSKERNLCTSVEISLKYEEWMETFFDMQNGGRKVMRKMSVCETKEGAKNNRMTNERFGPYKDNK